MKYLLLLLTLNAYAQFKVVITPDNKKHGKMFIEAETEEKAKQKLVKWIDRQKVYKGVWSESQEGSIVERVIQELEGNEITQYFKPNNFSVKIKDHTEEENKKKAKKKKRKDLKDKLKDKDLNLKEINELLRMM